MEQNSEYDRLKEDYQLVFNTPAGENVLSDLVRETTRTLIDRNNPSANAAVYKAGQLAFIDYIRGKLGINKYNGKRKE